MVEIYTDGSCLKNPNGPSGSGVIMIYKGRARVLSYSLGDSTNNRAELMAIKKALEVIKPDKRHFPIIFYTDSKYAIGVLTGKMKAAKNLDIIEETRQMLLNFPQVEFKWVKGHNGNRWNEVADRLAFLATKRPQGHLLNIFCEDLNHPFLNTL